MDMVGLGLVTALVLAIVIALVMVDRTIPNWVPVTACQRIESCAAGAR